MIVVGDADTVGEVLADDLTVGVDGFTIAAPANGHLPGRVDPARRDRGEGRRLIAGQLAVWRYHADA